ncbi:MAG: biotin/lipoate A/B protein ligase family protein [Cyanobacteria bacterium P01_A01_bin.114]
MHRGLPIRPTWRLIPAIEASGATQMAIDQWLLAQHQAGQQPSILRFYTWSPIAISLGYHQKRYPSHWQTLTWQDRPVDLVRRPTGGRAVLHQGELTYAVITSGLHGHRMDIYRHLCMFLICGWQSFGVTLAFGNAGRGYIHNPNCFGTATAADLVTPEGYKLIGSAQLYRNGCVLQHGSMRLQPDESLFEQVFEEALQPPSQSPHQSLRVNKTALLTALVHAAEQCFEMKLTVKPLSKSEIQTACQQYPINNI